MAKLPINRPRGRCVSFSRAHIVLLSNTRNAGNLPVKKKAAHINLEAPGAPEVTQLERGVILYSVI